MNDLKIGTDETGGTDILNELLPEELADDWDSILVVVPDWLLCQTGCCARYRIFWFL